MCLLRTAAEGRFLNGPRKLWRDELSTTIIKPPLDQTSSLSAFSAPCARIPLAAKPKLPSEKRGKRPNWASAGEQQLSAWTLRTLMSKKTWATQAGNAASILRAWSTGPNQN